MQKAYFSAKKSPNIIRIGHDLLYEISARTINIAGSPVFNIEVTKLFSCRNKGGHLTAKLLFLSVLIS